MRPHELRRKATGRSFVLPLPGRFPIVYLVRQEKLEHELVHVAQVWDWIDRFGIWPGPVLWGLAYGADLVALVLAVLIGATFAPGPWWVPLAAATATGLCAVWPMTRKLLELALIPFGPLQRWRFRWESEAFAKDVTRWRRLHGGLDIGRHRPDGTIRYLPPVQHYAARLATMYLLAPWWKNRAAEAIARWSDS